MGYPHPTHPKETPVLSKHFGDAGARTFDGFVIRFASGSSSQWRRSPAWQSVHATRAAAPSWVSPAGQWPVMDRVESCPP